jgi:hypothetical protein
VLTSACRTKTIYAPESCAAVYYTTTPTVFTTVSVTSTQSRCSCPTESVPGPRPQIKHYDGQHYHSDGKGENLHDSQSHSRRQLVVPSLNNGTWHQEPTLSPSPQRPLPTIPSDSSIYTITPSKPLPMDQAEKIISPISWTHKRSTTETSSSTSLLPRDTSPQFVSTYDTMTPEEYSYHQNEQQDHNMMEHLSQMEMANMVFAQGLAEDPWPLI